MSPRGELLYTSGTMVFAASTQGIPLDHLALVARWACVPGSHRTVTTGESVLGYHPQRTAQTVDRNTTPVFP